MNLIQFIVNTAKIIYKGLSVIKDPKIFFTITKIVSSSVILVELTNGDQKGLDKKQLAIQLLNNTYDISELFIHDNPDNIDVFVKQSLIPDMINLFVEIYNNLNVFIKKSE